MKRKASQPKTEININIIKSKTKKREKVDKKIIKNNSKMESKTSLIEKK